MRPRPDAAENCGPSARRGARLVASMRPRPDAAENDKALQGLYKADGELQ